MSSRRLVLFSGESEHFFFVENVGQKIKKSLKKILTADSTVKIMSKVAQKIRLIVLVKIDQ